MISSKCTECKQVMADGVLEHLDTCSANMFSPQAHTDYIRPPAIELTFDSPEEQAEWQNKLSGSHATPTTSNISNDLYGSNINGVLYQLVDTLMADTKTRIIARQLIDKTLSASIQSELAAYKERLVAGLPEKRVRTFQSMDPDVDLVNDNIAKSWNDCLDRVKQVIEAIE